MSGSIQVVAPPLPGGEIDYPFDFAFVFPGAADPIDLDTGRGLAMLLKATLVDISQQNPVTAPPLPGGEIDYPSAFQFSWPGLTSTYWPAATIARSSKPTDTPANTYVPAKLSGSINYGLSLFGGLDPLTQGSETVGVIELSDPDGELDYLAGLCWDGGAISILRGDPAADFSTWDTPAKISAAGLVYDHKVKQIQMRDLGWTLSQAELHGNRYGGTGGYDGDSTLASQVRPITFGQVFNISPVQINAALLIYEVSCTSVRAISAVRDGGGALTQGANYSTYAALAAATVAAGTYATCLAFGLFRLGGAPAKRVTADVQGDNDTLNGVGYPSTRGQIARRIATGRGTIRLDDSTQIDFAALAALELRQTAAVGFYFNQATSKADALTQVMLGCLGWWTVRLNGLLALGYVDDQTTSAATAVVRIPEDAVGEPTMQSYAPPRQATFVGWSKNYTTQTQDEIVGSVDQATAAIYVAATRYASDISSWIGRAWPTAPLVYVDGGFVNQSDAQLEATRQQRVMGTRRERWQVQVKMDPFADVLGRAIKVVGSTRYGFAGAKTMLCVGISVSGANVVTLDLWG